jgi:Rhodopirellula transposase DDE domain
VLAAETGLDITVCHFPPGTSKWNKIEHRLFSQIRMNWRGRPLTSHEVVVATIASTRTRTGLQVHAELDTASYPLGSYPLGIAVTRAQLAALPIEAHPQHGQWNYTIASTGGPLAVTAAGCTHERTRARTAALQLLADERLTGMRRDELAALAHALAPAQDAQAAQRRFEQRGGQRRRAPGAGSTGLLAPADRVLITIIYLRQICSQNVLSELLGINPNTIGQVIAETRQLLNEQRHTILPTTLRFTTTATLMQFLSSGEPEPLRSRVSEQLAHPALTGLSRAELAAMTERVKHVQDARNERHRHRRRGGERLPGARGGVFTQKITDAERVLATVLYQRKLCTQDTLAELFQVSRRTIGDVVREVGPILTQDGFTPTPAAARFANTADLLDSIPAATETATRPH